MSNCLNLVKIFAAIIFLCFFSSQGFAYAGATKGSYFQIDAVHLRSSNRLSISQEYKDYDTNVAAACDGYPKCYLGNEKPNAVGSGYGLNYKYAFSGEKTLVDPLQWLFIAPAIFYEKVNSIGTGKEYGNKVIINRRYGAKLDFGYDFDYGISPYLTTGISVLGYNVKVHDTSGSFVANKSGNDYGAFYGAGLAYSPFDKFSFVLEYNQQSNTLKSHVVGDYTSTGVPYGKVYATVRVFKFGVAYHF